VSALPRAINKHGDVKDRWRRHQHQSRITVMLRCRGKCEAGECDQEAREWAHIFGRRAIIAEPWASSPDATFGLCRHHHQQLDRNLAPDLLDRMRWIAVARLCASHSVPIPSTAEYDALGAIRAVVDVLEEQERG
jgi:hypothetical protein